MLTASIRLQASSAEVRQGLLGLLGQAWQEFWKAHLGVMEALCLATRHSCMTSPETTPNPQIFPKIRRCPKIPQKFPQEFILSAIQNPTEFHISAEFKQSAPA